MAFRFRLKALWRIRAIYEKQELLRLEAITQLHVQMKAQLAALKKDELEKAAALAERLKGGITGADLQIDVVCTAVRQKRMNAAARLVEELNQQVQKQLARYQQARQKLEVITRLRERQLSAYQRDEARRDQQQATDQFLLLPGTARDGQDLPAQSANLSPQDAQ